MEIKISHNKIVFIDEGVYAYTDFNDDLWNIINKSKWHVAWNRNKNRGYIRSGKGIYLHQLVMIHWYGQQVFDEAMADGCVIDHIDNNSFDCCINNLSFIPKNLNTAKGLVYDIEREQALSVLALNFFKDFQSGCYQITMGFNEPTHIVEGENLKSIVSIKLLYPNDYRRTFNDASSILYEFINHGEFDLDKLNYVNKEVEEAKYVYGATEGVVMIDGEPHLILSEKTKLNRVAPSKQLYNQVEK